MGLLQEAAILTGDAWRGAFCLANNLVNPNKARVEKMVNYGETTMHVTNDDGSFKQSLRGEHIPKGPFPGAQLAAELKQTVYIAYETPKQIEWRIVYNSQQAGK